MCQVFEGVKSSLPGPIFVLLWKATRLRSQNRLMMVMAILSSPPGLSRISMMTPFKVLEVAGDLVQSGCQLPLLDALQLKDPNVAKGLGPAIAKHPGPGLLGAPNHWQQESSRSF